jgi:hypothetical protein
MGSRLACAVRKVDDSYRRAVLTVLDGTTFARHWPDSVPLFVSPKQDAECPCLGGDASTLLSFPYLKAIPFQETLDAFISER